MSEHNVIRAVLLAGVVAGMLARTKVQDAPAAIRLAIQLFRDNSYDLIAEAVRG